MPRDTIANQFVGKITNTEDLAWRLYTAFNGTLPLANLDEGELDDVYAQLAGGNAFTDRQTFAASEDTVLTTNLLSLTYGGTGTTAASGGLKLVATNAAGALYVERNVAAAITADALVHFKETGASDQYTLKLENAGTVGTLNLAYTGSGGTCIVVSSGGILVAGNSTFSNQLTVTQKLTASAELEIDGALNHDGTTVGFYDVTPVTRPAALTQTYSTTTTTHANPTSSTLTDNTGATPDTTIENVPSATGDAGGAATVSAANAVATVASVNTALTAIENSLSDLADNQNKDRADLLNLKQFVNQIADYLQLNGLLQ